LNQGADGGFYGLSGAGFNPADPLFGGVYILTTKEGIVYEIDGKSGDLLTVKDTNGNTLTFTDGGIFSDTGKSVVFERDTQGRVSKVIDPAGNAIEYGYTDRTVLDDVTGEVIATAGDLIAVTDRENNTTRLEYHDTRAHYLDEIIDPLGRSGIRSEYGEDGRLSRILDVDGEEIELVYDPQNSIQTVKDAFGNPTVFEYDQRGNVVQEIDAVGKITKRTFDKNNYIETETIITRESGPEGWTTTYTNDQFGNVLSQTDPQGNTYCTTYQTFFGTYSRPLSAIDPLGNTTTFTYDNRGNTLSSTDANGHQINYTYFSNGNLRSIIEAEDDKTEYEYNHFGQLERMIDAEGNERSFTYDANGNLKTQTATLTTPSEIRTLITTIEFDREGRLLSVLDPENTLTQYQYDANGNQTVVIDAEGRRTEMRYNAKNQLIAQIYPDSTPDDLDDNPTITTTYDKSGNQKSVTNINGQITSYQYEWNMGQISGIGTCQYRRCQDGRCQYNRRCQYNWEPNY
jgi:YD repeat-containing protein